MNLKIGADPEFFVRKGRHFISGHIFNCGTKHQPLKTENGHVQVDGIALECNVPPADTRDAFISNTRRVVSDLSGIVRRVDDAAVLVARPTIFFGRRRLETLPKENSELGCTPDYNAYTGRKNPTPNRDLPIRTGSGHVHIGWTEDEDPRSIKFFNTCSRVVRQLDYYLGAPSLLWDSDARRRVLYGQAGAFRPKPYGLEYRVLSNAWLRSEKMIGFVFDRAVAAVKDTFAGAELDAEFEGLAQKIINENDTKWPDKYPSLAELVLV